jgi:Rps23 Pro-64 3,4-dihydroxylase Tpa1-like proline 4-hydroxylase
MYTIMKLLANVKSVRWKQTQSTKGKGLKGVPSVDKVIFTLLCCNNGSILEQHEDDGQTVSNARYCALPEEGPRNVISCKCWKGY